MYLSARFFIWMLKVCFAIPAAISGFFIGLAIYAYFAEKILPVKLPLNEPKHFEHNQMVAAVVLTFIVSLFFLTLCDFARAMIATAINIERIANSLENRS
jgi:hypothetical protein